MWYRYVYRYVYCLLGYTTDNELCTDDKQRDFMANYTSRIATEHTRSIIVILPFGTHIWIEV